MTEMEVMHWASVIAMAREGNAEMANYLRAENKIRRQQNRPSVEEELRQIANRASTQRKTTREIPWEQFGVEV